MPWKIVKGVLSGNKNIIIFHIYSLKNKYD